ncbi:trypsin-like peptidase domain-containing protein [Streptomyces sp. NPDC050619]|uniref:nSTAND1 domain-containing NTPase n=1 Tax=Streptomyces sp. NPDC050619 TaxID=3157214 RepID=UPI003426A47F
MTSADAGHPAPSADAVFEWGLARLLDEGGVPLGAGFLITGDLVCTCAHVLVDDPEALKTRSAVPDEPVLVDFPLLADGRSTPVAATVAEWRPEDDVAVLRLAHPVPGTAPLALASPAQPLWGREARVYGFPEDTDSGVNAHGTLRGGQGAGRIQLDTGRGSVPILPGFSGSPVWDVEARTVVGMIATRGGRSLAGTAYLIPARRLAPGELEMMPGGTGPFKGLLRFEEEDAHLFHGREQDARALAEAVRERPLALLTGQSGTGKSSVLRAGLLPRLRAADAVVVVRTPREADHPAEFLGEALLALWDAADGAALSTAVREALSGDGLALARLRERLRAAAGGRLCVLVIDQFEEYAAAAPRAARRVVTWLRELTGVADPVPDRGLRAVLSARNATLDALATALPAAQLTLALVRLDPLTDDALARVISQPLRSVPGAGLEPGLTELLLRDAHEAQDSHGEANALPLLEFTLAELWRRRSGGTLTHAAYRDLGGLSGAVARHAQDTLDEAIKEGLADEEAARRLFQRLARPHGLGRFLPDTVPAAELDPSQQALAQRMVREKLLVWTRAQPGGSRDGSPSQRDEASGESRSAAPREASGESLRMAHEALLREWEWLRTCLREGEEFRAWQAEVEEHARAWDASGRRPIVFAPEKLLSAADRWRSERARDITDVQRGYLAAGRRHARRGAYVLRAFAATVTVLTLLAGWLAWDASRSRDQAEEQLREVASGQLADLAEQRSSTDLGLSVQAAMGAWATARTEKAEGALFRQYLRMRDVEQVHSGLWKGNVRGMTSAPGKDVVAVTTAPAERGGQEVRIVTGAASGHPRVQRLGDIPNLQFQDAFSDDGRWYALAAADGSVRRWQVGAQGGAEPRVLPGARPKADEFYDSYLDFSDDGSRLLRVFSYGKHSGRNTAIQVDALNVWDVSSGEAIPTAGGLVDGREVNGAAFADDGEQVVISWYRQSTSGSFVAVFGLADGEVRRRLVTDRKHVAELTARGTLVDVGGPNGSSSLITLDGTELDRGVPKHLFNPDASELYLLESRQAASRSSGAPDYSTVTLNGLLDDDIWTAVAPTDGTSQDNVNIAVWEPREGSRKPRAVVAVGGSLLRLRLTEGGAPPAPGSNHEQRAALAPDGSRYATLAHGLLYMSRPGDPARSAALPGKPKDNGTWELTWVRTEKRDAVAAWDSEGLGLSLYAADDSVRRLDVDLPAQVPGLAADSRIESVAQLGNGDLAVLLSSNEVVRLDPRTGTRVADPLRVAAEGTPGASSWPGQLVPRPGHAAQALIVTGSGHQEGELMLWDLGKRSRMTRWTTPAGVQGLNSPQLAPSTVMFSADGRLVAVAHDDNKLRFWDVATGRKVGDTVSLPGTDLVAFLGTDTLITLNADYDLRLHTAPGGRALGEAPSSLSSEAFAAAWTGTDLRILTAGQMQTLSTDPDTWWRSLCRSTDRPYTEAEREELPPGAHTGRPCSAS